MKLGLKKKDGGKSEPKKEKKRKNRSSGGSDAAKTWMINNGEKVVLTVVVLAVAWVIYSGFSKEGLKAGQSPDDLEKAIGRSRTYMTQEPWESVAGARHPEPDDFDSKASLDIIAVNLDHYPAPTPFHTILLERQRLRQVPKILVATDLEVRTGYGWMTYEDEGAELTTEIDNDPNSRNFPENISRKFSNSSLRGSSVRAAFFSVVTAVAPLKEQLQAYNEAFIGAADYQSDRDFPKYVGYLLERRPYTNGAPGDWQAVDSLAIFSQATNDWGTSSGDEILGDMYIDPFLTMTFPPIVGKDVHPLMVHTKFKLQEQIDLEEREQADLENRGGHRESFFDNEEEGKSTESTEEVSLEDEALRRLTTDLTLVRFIDLDVKPGQQYDYRIKLLLEDPNDPKDNKRPPIDACDVSIIELRKRNEGNQLRNVLESNWSEPSPIATIPFGGSVLAGVAQGEKFVSGTPAVEPSIKLLAIGWDGDRNLEIPVEMDAKRGTLLNFRGDLEAIDPARQRIVKLPQFPMSTGAVVLDIKGGEMLHKSRKRNEGIDEVTAPSMVLVMTQDGEIRFQNEIADNSDYQMNVIGEDPEVLRAQEEAKRDRANKRNRDRGDGGEQQFLPDEERGGRRNRGRAR